MCSGGRGTPVWSRAPRGSSELRGETFRRVFLGKPQGLLGEQQEPQLQRRAWKLEKLLVNQLAKLSVVYSGKPLQGLQELR